MLRISSTVLDFADSAATSVDVSAPLAFPTVSGRRESQDVLVNTEIDGQAMPGQIQVPIPTWEALPAYLRAVVEGVPGAAVDYFKEYFDKIEEASKAIRTSHREVIEEYLKYSTAIPEEKFREWFKKVVLIRNPVLEDIRGPRMKLQSIGVNAIPKQTYEELVRAQALIESMPEGTGKDALIRATARRLVFKTEMVTRQKLEVSSEVARKLGAIKWGFFAIAWIGPSVELLTARTYGQFKAAVIRVAKTVGEYAGGIAGAFAAPAVGYAIAAAFALTPAGWVIVGLTIVTGAALGIVAGHYAEEAARNLLPDINPEITLD